MLTLRPTRLGTSPVYVHLKDYSVFEDGKMIGRMYEQRSPAPPDAAWVWSIIVIAPGRPPSAKMGETGNDIVSAVLQLGLTCARRSDGGLPEGD